MTQPTADFLAGNISRIILTMVSAFVSEKTQIETMSQSVYSFQSLFHHRVNKLGITNLTVLPGLPLAIRPSAHLLYWNT